MYSQDTVRSAKQTAEYPSYLVYRRIYIFFIYFKTLLFPDFVIRKADALTESPD